MKSGASPLFAFHTGCFSCHVSFLDGRDCHIMIKEEGMKEKVVQVTAELVTPILERTGLELVDIEYVKEGGNWFLRVFIDQEGGIDLDTCGRVSEQLSKLLDRKDPIPGPYILEVSSPGAERPLKTERDLERSIGKPVLVTLYEPFDGSKKHTGRLEAFDKDVLTLSLEAGKQLEIPREKIAQTRLTIDWTG